MDSRRIGLLAILLIAATACGGDGNGAGGAEGARGESGRDGASPAGRRGDGGPAPGGMGGPPGGGPGQAAVPVETVGVVLRDISSYIETNGVLEAENEVDLVARTAGPIVELAVEEGMQVSAGQRVARIDDKDVRAQLEIARVELSDAELAFRRAEQLREEELVSVQEYETARARFESAQAQYEGSRVLLAFTDIRAPFDGLVAERYVKFAQHVTNGTPLFRLTDFDPLLCKIQVPERDLPALRQGQLARLEVDAWPGERFPARVLRISPVVESATGTIRVTLEARGSGKLRPGMFAKVFVETATHQGVRVIPRSALTLDSIGDTVFVAHEGLARRRDVRLGFREGDFVEVLEGLEAGELVVVVGQDGLAEGTPIQVLDARVGTAAQHAAPVAPGAGLEAGATTPGGSAPVGSPQQAGRGPRSKGDFDPSKMTPAELERAKESMRARGMTEEQIDERLRRARERGAAGSQ